ncbi:MAG: B-box zinc finger protein [Armatimonadota bacterium]
MNEQSTTESEVIYCTRHPREETGVSCASCGTPICPKCMVVTPVGMKCPDCARSKNSTLFQIRPERLLLAMVVSLVAGVIAAVIGNLGFFVIFLSVPYGYYAGDMILKSAGMKRGWKLEVTAGVFMVAGGLAVKLLPGLLVGKFIYAGLMDPFFWLALAISTGAALSKIRYM